MRNDYSLADIAAATGTTPTATQIPIITNAILNISKIA